MIDGDCMYPEQFEELVEAFRMLPGVGAKTAERYAFAFLEWSKDQSNEFLNGLSKGKDLKRCKVCGNLSSKDLCTICSDPERNQKLICVVETPKDLQAIEQMEEYQGVYHVLNGTINLQKGILPESLNIPSLEKRVSSGVDEVILALNPNMAGETTSLYLSRMLSGKTNVTRLASGIPMGGNLDYLDAVTLKRAFQGRSKAEQD